MVGTQFDQPPLGAQGPTKRICENCGITVDWHAKACPYCGHVYGLQTSMQIPKTRNIWPAIGGVLILVSGVLAILMGLMFVVFPDDTGALDSTEDPVLSQEAWQVCGGVGVVFGIVAVFGGVFGIMRKQLVLVVVGGVFGILGFGMFVGSALAAIGLVFVYMGRHDF
jgi:hypothetical protein